MMTMTMTGDVYVTNDECDDGIDDVYMASDDYDYDNYLVMFTWQMMNVMMTMVMFLYLIMTMMIKKGMFKV